jgi:hypothetical protein
MVRTTTRGQSVYPDIALYISNYCFYWIEDTQNIISLYTVFGPVYISINRNFKTPSMILIKSTLKIFICLYVRFYLFLKLEFLLRFLDSLKIIFCVSSSEDHMESIQPIKCMLFILIFNKFVLYLNTIDYAYICSE